MITLFKSPKTYKTTNTVCLATGDDSTKENTQTVVDLYNAGTNGKYKMYLDMADGHHALHADHYSVYATGLKSCWGFRVLWRLLNPFKKLVEE